MAAASPLVVFLFLLLATFAQSLLAFYGLLSRYVQVVSVPGIPALRLVVVVNLIAEAAMVALHLLPFKVAPWVAAWLRARRQRRGARGAPQPPAAPASKAAAPAAADEESGSAEQEEGSGGGRPPSGGGSVDGQQSSGPQQCSASESSAATSGGRAAGQPPGAAPGGAAPAKPPPPGAAPSTLRPPLPLVRGLSRRVEAWQRRRPALHRRLVLAALTLSFTGVCSLQMLAPGFLDVAIVQLTTQWTPLCIALVQRLLLGHRLPRAFWPAAAAILGGATMVIVPAVGQSASGSLATLQGWEGFMMAVGALLCTTAYYAGLQATRHLGFTALQLQHLMNTTSFLLFLPISLPVDGTDWAAQFGPWGAGDWAILVALSTACYIGAGVLMQLCVWKLGAPTAAMFFGLRLIFAVALSSPVLGSTVVRTPVQIAGVAVTACAVTAFAFSQWWAARQAQRHARGAEAGGGGGGAGGGGVDPRGGAGGAGGAPDAAAPKAQAAV